MFTSLNGQYVIVNYGVCMSADSPLDGRVVHDDSDCPFHPLREDFDD
jgi:hypothetical protein